MYNINTEILNVNQYISNHKKEFNREFGAILREIRCKKDIPIEIMASRTFMSPSYIIQVEKGINGISLNKFILICNALEVDPKELLEIFLFGGKNNEDVLYNELQKDKNISLNILEFMKNKSN